MKYPCGKVFDVNKPVQTREGKEVEILKRHLKLDNGESIVGLIYLKGWQDCCFYFDCGHFMDDHEDCLTDLINIETKQTIDWNKPICVVDEMSDDKFPAIVIQKFKNYVVLELSRGKSTIIASFSLDGKTSIYQSNFMKLVAKNI